MFAPRGYAFSVPDSHRTGVLYHKPSPLEFALHEFGERHLPVRCAVAEQVEDALLERRVVRTRRGARELLSRAGFKLTLEGLGGLDVWKV